MCVGGVLGHNVTQRNVPCMQNQYHQHRFRLFNLYVLYIIDAKITKLLKKTILIGSNLAHIAVLFSLLHSGRFECFSVSHKMVSCFPSVFVYLQYVKRGLPKKITNNPCLSISFLNFATISAELVCQANALKLYF